MMNKSYIGFHTYKDETIELKLPKKEALRNLFNGKLYPAAKTHDIHVEKNKTYLFERINPPVIAPVKVITLADNVQRIPSGSYVARCILPGSKS